MRKKIISGVVLAAGLALSASMMPYNAEAAAMPGEFQLVKGQIGEVTILHDTYLYQLGLKQQVTCVRTLKTGSKYRVYSVGKIGGVTYYGVGSGFYVKAASSVKYISLSKSSNVKNGITAALSPTINTQLVNGQIGKVSIHQDTPLYQLGSNKHMTMIRTLKKGSTYRVYSVNQFAGVTYYGVGSGFYVKATSAATYAGPSNAVTVQTKAAATAGASKPNSTPSSKPLLNAGSTGAAVKQVQQILNGLGYNAGTADGIFGQNTKTAIVQFQNVNGLNANGTVENSTWNALLSGTAKRNVSAGYKFGSDSNTSSNPKGNDIYFGQLGYSSTANFNARTGSGTYFNSIAAHKASYVYGYWFLAGMQKAPRGTSASNWGAQQAKLALNTYQAMRGIYGSKARHVIFVDVESASSGMRPNDYTNNLAVYNAFVNYINQHGQGVKPGTYTSPGDWKAVMGSFSPRTPGAYWVAHYPGGVPSNLTTNNPSWSNFPNTNEQAQIWQYYGGSVDYDVAWKLPYEI